MARAAGGGSAGSRQGPPATVTTAPGRAGRPNADPPRATTSRTRQLPVSATNRSPLRSVATALGASSRASRAGPPSPPKPARPVPATVRADGDADGAGTTAKAWPAVHTLGTAAPTSAATATRPAETARRRSAAGAMAAILGQGT